MSSSEPEIVRIVVKGSPSGRRKNNVAEARDMLLKAFGSSAWPTGTAKFAITPGGFIRVPFPNQYDGKHGWGSRPKDFEKIIPFAQKAIDEVLTEKVLKAVRGRAKFLTLGVDLNEGGSKFKIMSLSEPHAEVVGVVNTASGKVIHWTGKSYPVTLQEKYLVYEANLESHLFRYSGERVLILGCHDLNMFSNRGYENQKPDGLRRKRCDKMRKLAKDFKPTTILQHPHSTDSQHIWAAAWGVARTLLPNHHIYASGIAFYNSEGGTRQNLADVLRGTRCCDSHVVDVKVTGSRKT